MTDQLAPDPPSPLVATWAPRLAAHWNAPRALDLAAGRGRNIGALVAAGYRVTAIDINAAALQDAVRRARAACRSAHTVRAVAADLTMFPLPRKQFELVVVTRFLQRDLFPSLIESLVPGGVLVYETFTELQLLHGSGPRSASHLLKPGELRIRLRELEVLFDEEIAAPDALAHIVARRRS